MRFELTPSASQADGLDPYPMITISFYHRSSHLSSIFEKKLDKVYGIWYNELVMIKLKVFDQDDIHNVALCAWKETRGDGIPACQAVALVIFNRARDWIQSYHEVVYGKNQFSSMSIPSDAEYNLQPDPAKTYEYGIYKELYDNVVPEVLRGHGYDISIGAHYYANLATMTSGWFVENISGQDGKGLRDHPFTVKIGKQSFFI